MPSRSVEIEKDRPLLEKWLANFTPPFVVSVTLGRKRSLEQNKLQRLWCTEVAEQLGDRTAEEVRGETKLRCAVPILRAEDDAFCAAYDKHVKGLPYETKMACMMEPIDFPVTRRMTVKQNRAFLDAMFAYWTDQGVILTRPEE